jgi:hypothetical protein
VTIFELKMDFEIRLLPEMSLQTLRGSTEVVPMKTVKKMLVNSDGADLGQKLGAN